jgi:hypothetical protein
MANAPLAYAQGATDQAREAYDRGAAAYDKKDYTVAAPELARADVLAPNVTVLELALEASVRAQNAPLVMELAQRAEDRAQRSTPLYRRAQDARAKFEGQVGRVVVRCPPPAVFCRATLDGKNLAVDQAQWTLVGDHAIDLDADGAAEHRAVHVSAKELVEVTPSRPVAPVVPAPVPAPIARPEPAPAPPPSQPPQAEPPHPPLSPAWFWIGAGATVVAGGVLTWSALDTKNAHDDFDANPTSAGRTAGRSAQLRTNVFIGATIGLAAITSAVGLFFVEWGHGPNASRLDRVGRF